MAGRTIAEVIADNFSRADAALFVISQGSQSSQNVLAELGTALHHAQTRGMLVVPAVIDDSPIPTPLQNVMTILARSGSLEEKASEIASKFAQAWVSHVDERGARENERLAAQRRVEGTAAKYIATSLTELRKRENTDRWLAHIWYSMGFAFLISGAALALWRIVRIGQINGAWLGIAEFGILGLIAVGLLVALAKFAFTLGKSFMVEALRTADRVHAISFGQFYLNAFGDRAEWASVKEALQHWNIDRGSAFLSQEPGQFDPKLLETAVAIAKAVTAARGDAKKK
jgi:hypothetical protein